MSANIWLNTNISDTKSVSLLIFITILILLTVWQILLFVKYKKLKRTFRSYKNAVRSITKTINSVRYGNIYDRVDKNSASILPVVTESVERMIEAIVDREDMIKEYQKDLSDQIEAQKEIQKLKEDFVATLTHDLKVPIIAETNMLNFLLENRFGELSEKQKEAVYHLKNSNKELVELVEILLETYKLNEMQINLTKEPVDICRLIENVLDEMQPIAEANSVSFRFERNFDENVVLDEFYFKRVLKNLILNAISFSNSNSSVDVKLDKEGKKAVILIKNYGNTINNKEINHIFDKYYSTSNKFRKVGTGLGLYLSNKIIKAHKGEIVPECNYDENSTTMKISLKI